MLSFEQFQIAPTSLTASFVPPSGIPVYAFGITQLDWGHGCARWQRGKGDPESLRVHSQSSIDWRLKLETESGESVWRLSNSGHPIGLSGGKRLERGESVDVKLPCQIRFDDQLVDIFPSNAPPDLLQASTQLPARTPNAGRVNIRQQGLGDAPSSITLAHWFDALLRLQREVAGTDEYFERATEALLEPGGMDAGLILERNSAGWIAVGASIPHPEFGTPIYLELLDEVERTGATCFHASSSLVAESADDDFPVAVAAPIWDEQERIAGAVYGIRSQHRRNQRRGIRPLEAFFVQQVAETVASGMIRRQRETEFARKSVLLEQTFPAGLVDQLVDRPEILDGHQRLVTVLFCDLRNFSRICDRLADDAVYRLLSHVMDYLTDEIRQNDGVIIDYFGDGLAAFWNAPIDQPQHADKSCRTAIAMRLGIPDLNMRWMPEIGLPLDFGIGIHTGLASVGNSGSRYRIKYGPRGKTVNIAQRIEAATKHLKSPILLSSETVSRLGESFRCRRVCSTRLPGVPAAVPVFQPFPAAEYEQRLQEMVGYELALAAFERGDFPAACRELESIRDLATTKDEVVAALFEQSLARREGRFDRRREDEQTAFIALPTNEETQV